MLWWTTLIDGSWAIATDMLNNLYVVLIIPIAFAVVAFVFGLVRGD